MNHRLLSHAEKFENARSRNRRNAQRQWRRRRERLLGDLGFGIGDALVDLDLLSPADSMDLVFGHLIRARNVAARISRLGRGGDVVEDVQQDDQQLPAVLRPRRVLREDRRSKVYPWLLPPERPSKSTFSLAMGLAAARILAAAGDSPHHLLDFLACSADLPWHTAAHLLHRDRLVSSPFADLEIEEIRRSRLFWDRYDSARGAYAAMLKAGEIRAAAGDWAVVDSAVISSLFPGMIIPIALRRMAYLLNRVVEGAELCFDFHAYPSRLFLFQHPF